jgi:hypothetical protein
MISCIYLRWSAFPLPNQSWSHSSSPNPPPRAKTSNRTSPRALARARLRSNSETRVPAPHGWLDRFSHAAGLGGSGLTAARRCWHIGCLLLVMALKPCQKRLQWAIFPCLAPSPAIGATIPVGFCRSDLLASVLSLRSNSFNQSCSESSPLQPSHAFHA